MKHFQEVEQLRQEKLEIDQQLRSIHGSGSGGLGSMQSLSQGGSSSHHHQVGGGSGGYHAGHGASGHHSGR